LDAVKKVQDVYSDTPISIFFRSHNEFVPLFDGLEIVRLGVVLLDEW